MPRRARAPIRPVEPDSRHRSRLVQQLINKVMVDGKQSLAEQIVYDALALVGERTGRDPVEVLDEAIRELTPALEVRSRRSLRGDLGLVWVDAHMDSHTPGTSHTGRLHGMPLAWLLGQDDDPLYGLASGVLDPRHVCLVGVRSYEPEESERLARLGVRVYLMEEVRQRGLRRALDEALRIASQDTAGFGISIDLDVVTPEDAPGVAVPAEGGLGGAEPSRADRAELLRAERRERDAGDGEP